MFDGRWSSTWTQCRTLFLYAVRNVCPKTIKIKAELKEKHLRPLSVSPWCSAPSRPLDGRLVC